MTTSGIVLSAHISIYNFLSAHCNCVRKPKNYMYQYILFQNRPICIIIQCLFHSIRILYIYKSRHRSMYSYVYKVIKVGCMEGSQHLLGQSLRQ